MNSSFKSLHPLVQLTFILLIIGLMALLGVFVAILLCKPIFGTYPNMSTLSGIVTEDVGMLRLIQAVSTIFMFIGSAIIAAKLNGESFKNFFHLAPIRPTFLILIAITMFIMAAPTLTWLVDISEKMGFKGNANNNALMESLIFSKNIYMLLLNLFVFALLPAIGEELMFRGMLQKWLMNQLKSPWLGIILTGLVFSLIHMEWDYFLARWLMGSLLGLMFYTSRSIWLPILAHFVNNSIAVISYYLYTSHPDKYPINPINSQATYTWIELSLSIFVITLMAIMLYKYRKITANTLSKLTFSV